MRLLPWHLSSIFTMYQNPTVALDYHLLAMPLGCSCTQVITVLLLEPACFSVSGDEFWIWGCFMLPLCWCKGCHKAEGDKACGSPTRKHQKNRWKKSHTTVTYQLLLKSLQMILIINFYAVPYWTMSYLILAAIQTGRFLFRGIPLVMTFAKNRQKPQRNVFTSF